MKEVNPLSYVGDMWKALTDLGLTVRVAGSIRRMKTEPNDIDLIIVFKHEGKTGKCIRPSSNDQEVGGGEIHSSEYVDEAVINRVKRWFEFQGAVPRDIKNGNVQLRYDTSMGVQVDIYFCHENEYGAMLMFLTGSAGYNIGLRTLARKFGYTLSQWGLFDREGNCMAQRTEEDIYRVLGKPYKNPEERD